MRKYTTTRRRVEDVQFNLRIPRELRDALQAVCSRQALTPSGALRRLIENFVAIAEARRGC